MTDIELLELAAKAAKYKLVPNIKEGYPLWIVGLGIWNPLQDDGTALRLLINLRMDLFTTKHGVDVMTTENRVFFEEITDLQDVYMATRRVIVRAAAEIGKGMKV
jgi:hypothetical protein